MTQSTADAFIVTTKTVIAASEYLLKEHSFQYVFFGKARQSTGGNC